MRATRTAPAGRHPDSRRAEWAVTSGSLAWLVVLFALPTVLVVVLSFKPADPLGGFGSGWSAAAWRELANPGYPPIIWRTLWLSVLTTVVCVLLGLPVGYLMGRCTPRWRHLLVVLVVVPFWTNFLIRVFAWKTLLHPNGWVKRLLASAGLVPDDAILLYNEWAVLLVMVYTYLPFAILPLYAAAERFDFSLLDAARDLGAGPVAAFVRVFIPGVSRGLLAAVVMVLIPALGTYVISDMVGGASTELLGNKLAQRALVDRNMPHAAALATVLIAVTFVPVILAFLFGRGGAATTGGGGGRKAGADGRPGREVAA